MKTTLQTFALGDQLVTTVHRIEADGRETADVLSVSDPLHLELEETVERAVPREHQYAWQSKYPKAKRTA